MHSKRSSVHSACLSQQFEFNLPARESGEMLFARLSVIIAVLLCYAFVSVRAGAVVTRDFISISQFAIAACQ